MAGLSSKGSKFYISDSNAELKVADVVANLTSIGAVSVQTDEIDTTTLDSGDYKEFNAGMKDSGEIAISGNLIDDSGFAKLQPLFDSSLLTKWGIASEGSEEACIQGTGFVKTLEWGERTPDGLLTFSATVRISGKVLPFTKPVVAG